MAGERPKVGVLAIQGAVNEHLNCLKQLDCTPVLVKREEHFEKLEGLIIPGGESTTIGKLLQEYGFDQVIKRRVKQGMGVFGTCAGLILLVDKIDGYSHSYLGLINITVRRNSFGRQIDSFETDLEIPGLGIESFSAIFIRAPEIIDTTNKVTILAKYKEKIVMARQERILVSSFHPELTGDLRVHQYFLNLITANI